LDDGVTRRISSAKRSLFPGLFRQFQFDDRAHPGGQTRALAVTTPARFESLPDIPTVGEFVPD
jgi:hypothetical protein